MCKTKELELLGKTVKLVFFATKGLIKGKAHFLKLEVW